MNKLLIHKTLDELDNIEELEELFNNVKKKYLHLSEYSLELDRQRASVFDLIRSHKLLPKQ